MKQNISDQQITEIYETYSDMVYRLAYSRTANRSIAEDVFQTVFLTLVDNIHKLTDDAHIKNWLIRVTINCCRKTFRHKNNVTYLDTLEKEADPSTAEDSSIENAVLKKERTVILKHALQMLQPDEYRDILYLFYYEQLSIGQIASILLLTPGATKTKLSRARNSLKKILDRIY